VRHARRGRWWPVGFNGSQAFAFETHPKETPMSIRPAVLVAAAALTLAVLTGCAVDHSPSAGGTAPKPAAVEKEPVIPVGFNDGKDGVAFRHIEDDVCDYGQCAQVELYAYANCTNSVYVEANLLDGDKRVIGYANDRLGPLRVGEYGVASLQITENAAASVTLTEVTCS
jgi:hypothetical protein